MENQENQPTPVTEPKTKSHTTTDQKAFTEEEIETAMEEWIKANPEKEIEKDTYTYTKNGFGSHNIFKQRPILFIWLLIYATITWGIFKFSIEGFLLTIGIHFIIINIALSDFAEDIMRHLEDIREISTSREKERLLHLFDEVYQKAKKHSPNISTQIELYIVDEISVNALALGTNTIAISRGLMEVMDDDEIKGILAHELGHMAYNDPRIQQLIQIGSSIFLWIGLIIRWICRKLELATTGANNQATFVSVIVGFVRWLADISISVITLIATLLFMYDSRKKEYRADLYTVDLGYGYELTQALYNLYDMQISDKRSLIERFKASHPRVAYRIGKLEEIEIDTNWNELSD